MNVGKFLIETHPRTGRPTKELASAHDVSARCLFKLLGRDTLRRRGRLHHIGVGRPYAGWRVAMLIDGLDIEIVGVDGSPLRRLVLDPTKDYQRIP